MTLKIMKLGGNYATYKYNQGVTSRKGIVPFTNAT